MAEPPSELGACQERLTCVFPGVATRLNGAVGTVPDGGDPSAGAHGTRGAPPPAPRAPAEVDTVSHFAWFQLSMTFRFVRILSMSLDHALFLSGGSKANPNFAKNSSFTFP